MIMLETIFSILAAIITMVIAGRLVKKQNQLTEKTEELNCIAKDNLENLAVGITALTGTKAIECSITYLECRLDTFNQTLNVVKKPTYKRRNRNVKCKKNFTDD